MSFTAKKRAYVKARMAGKNIQDSAIEAGYSTAAARQAGSRLEKDAEVIAAFARLKAGGKIDAPKDTVKSSKIVNKKTSKPSAEKTAAPVESVGLGVDVPDWAKMLAPPKPKRKSKDIEETKEEIVCQSDDPLDFMRHMMKDSSEDPRLRLEAAKSLAAYTLSKPGEKGKKEEKADAAKEVARKFGTIPPPKMQLVKK